MNTDDPASALSAPTLVQVELTNACNLACPMCGRSNQKRSVGEMDLELAKQIIQQSAQFQYPIQWFHAFGEPLLYSHLEEVLQFFTKVGFGPGSISTNGVLLDSKRRAILIQHARKVLVALDTSRPDIYRELRVNSNFEEVVDNIKKLIEESEASKLSVGIQCLRTKLNSDETSDDFEALFGEHPHVSYFFKRTVQYPRSEDYALKETQPLVKTDCDFPLWQLSILYNGDCTLCCWDYDGEQVIGNVKFTSLYEIWNGSAACAMREQLSEGRFGSLPLCSACTGPPTKKPESLRLF